jgi:hypothetical protein
MDIPDSQIAKYINQLSTNRYAFYYIHNPTEEICLTALKYNPYLISAIPKDIVTAEMCLIAIEQNPYLVKHIKMPVIPLDEKDFNIYSQIYNIAVFRDGDLLQYVPPYFHSYELYIVAIKNDPFAIQYIRSTKPHYTLICDDDKFKLLSQSDKCELIDKLRTQYYNDYYNEYYELYLYALSRNGIIIRSVIKENITKEMYEVGCYAISFNSSLAQYYWHFLADMPLLKVCIQYLKLKHFSRLMPDGLCRQCSGSYYTNAVGDMIEYNKCDYNNLYCERLKKINICSRKILIKYKNIEKIFMQYS